MCPAFTYSSSTVEGSNSANRNGHEKEMGIPPRTIVTLFTGPPAGAGAGASINQEPPPVLGINLRRDVRLKWWGCPWCQMTDHILIPGTQKSHHPTGLDRQAVHSTLYNQVGFIEEVWQNNLALAVAGVHVPPESPAVSYISSTTTLAPPTQTIFTEGTQTAWGCRNQVARNYHHLPHSNQNWII